ncbi:uncharacterized protein CMU_022170 [Cryptosporidium muris RN66]|uniref:Uncharacterized protein n=1 Tax=Cryptosporidium muris (strain RN66) TaxID=441375 RepID=B6AK44_CRYMR|nr:uncharacterized protein CMU_022170 [Cryptosporidium muris RN66]EEA08585.1 hypothetical protein, conserved [Cryptosporidium muris RN66]|eukprot:XP_002142934.1 hypothetical protein [Cryptosporidium muris RN66]
MQTQCSKCIHYQNDIEGLQQELHRLRTSNIRSQGQLEKRYKEKLNSLSLELSLLKDLSKEYDRYKIDSENYTREMNAVLIEAKSKLEILQNKLGTLEYENSKLTRRCSELEDILFILEEQRKSNVNTFLSDPLSYSNNNPIPENSNYNRFNNELYTEDSIENSLQLKHKKKIGLLNLDTSSDTSTIDSPK